MLRPQSLRSKLLIAVTALIAGSGMVISLVVSYHFSRNIYAAARVQARHLAHQIALEATEKVLINDLVALQKMIDHHMRSTPALSYLFIVRGGRILAHSFTDGFPVELIDANDPGSGRGSHLKRISAVSSERYVDAAMPVFDGKAGILRLGLSEKFYRRQVLQLWLQMSLVTLTVLVTGIVLSHFFIRRITGPLAILSASVESVDGGQLDVKVPLSGADEVGRLATAFNRMLKRIQDYTRRLEEKTTQLDRAYQQTRRSFAIVQEIGAQSNLVDACTYLIREFQGVVSCQQMAMMVLLGNRRNLVVVTEAHTAIHGGDDFETALSDVRGLNGITCVKPNYFGPQILTGVFLAAKELAVCPVENEDQPIAALVTACTHDCLCDRKGLEVIDLILHQTAGALKRAAQQEEQIRGLQQRIEQSAEFSGIIGKDDKMRRIYQLIEDIAPTDATVLIQGESGTGKELVAKAIHGRSPRYSRPFVVINCSAFPTTLLESELFGHEKGAFTGAVRRKIGRFEQADGGTVFLDEIGEIAPSAQIKLLRVIQTQRFERLGAEKTLGVNVRILAATNRNLLEEVRMGRFREDLFYRLNVIPIVLPPLRDRKNDIPLLARHFLKRFGREQDKRVTDFRTETMRRLLDYPWPGNVRELENSIEHAAVLAKSTLIAVSDLPVETRKSRAAAPADRRKTIVENEKKLLAEVLGECGWNKKKAASRLGISRSTLYDKIKKYEIIKPTLH